MVHPITKIQTVFKEKFGIPRQSLLIKEAMGVMEFPKNDFFMEAFRSIENYSHLWLVFEFHEAKSEGVKALVRPPRFFGQEKIGVFASRSPHRPNHLGLSVVKFESLEILPDKVLLKVSGVDILDGTPILDIKPYLPYSDSIEAIAKNIEKPVLKEVVWSSGIHVDKELKTIIEKVIALDPRPSFDRDKEFGVSVANYNIRFIFKDECFHILECKEIL